VQGCINWYFTPHLRIVECQNEFILTVFVFAKAIYAKSLD
jgi:hypothetical protein